MADARVFSGSVDKGDAMRCRLTTAQLLKLGSELSGRDRELVGLVARLRLMSHRQLTTVAAGDAELSPSATRDVRRRLLRLSELGLLARLERRVGGVRAGSAGFVYYLGPAGQRLMAYWAGRGLVRGRHRPEPGGRYVAHRLAVSQLYVDLLSSARRGESDLLTFDVEPDCWRDYSNGLGGRTLLKPDAFVRLGVGAYEDRYFVEVDLGTESRPVIARKARSYIDYFASGEEQAAHGVFPRVVLLTNSEARRSALAEICSRLPAEHWQLFTVGLLDQGAGLATGQVETEPEPGRAIGGLQ